MRFGIYYAYWEHEWGGNFIPYIEKVKRLGFDILEVACGDFYLEDGAFFDELRRASEYHGVTLTGGYGPRPEHNLAAKDETAVEKAFAFYADLFQKMERAGIGSLGGALYSYWPVNFNGELDKRGDFERSVENIKRLADMAINHGITLNMEALNRFEGYLLNTAKEAVEYVKAVGQSNVKVMLDTFHMNIEEDSFSAAFELAGNLLGRFHVGEANRKPPFENGRMPWMEIGKTLKKINYTGDVVMEPFVLMGGQVGKDISIWRDISEGATPAELDKAAADSVAFLRRAFIM